MTKEEMIALDDAIRRDVEVQAKVRETATMVCVPAEGESYFDDDVHGECDRCGDPIRWRPYVPAHWDKLCIDCVGAQLIEEDFR